VKYPQVVNEFATIDAVLAGKSIARFGDGEFKLADFTGYRREPGSEKLALELRSILHSPHHDCLVAIPTMDPAGPKYDGWIRHRDRFGKLLRNPKSQILHSPFSILNYYSAFITRPDSAPWINNFEYAQNFEQLWRQKRVAVLCEDGNSILKAVQLSAKKLEHVECPHREAYAQIDELEAALLHGKPEVAILSCGPTATCLANRLAAKGIHSVDIGSAGGFVLKLLTKC